MWDLLNENIVASCVGGIISGLIVALLITQFTLLGAGGAERVYIDLDLRSWPTATPPPAPASAPAEPRTSTSSGNQNDNSLWPVGGGSLVAVTLFATYLEPLLVGLFVASASLALALVTAIFVLVSAPVRLNAPAWLLVSTSAVGSAVGIVSTFLIASEASSARELKIWDDWAQMLYLLGAFLLVVLLLVVSFGAMVAMLAAFASWLESRRRLWLWVLSRTPTPWNLLAYATILAVLAVALSSGWAYQFATSQELDVSQLRESVPGRKNSQAAFPLVGGPC
jgi:hypothetical protein